MSLGDGDGDGVGRSEWFDVEKWRLDFRPGYIHMETDIHQYVGR